MNHKLSLSALVCIMSCMLAASAFADRNLFKGGHAKYIFQLNTFPDESIFLDVVDTPSVDHFGDLRLKFSGQKDAVRLAADYQLLAGKGDGFVIASSLPGNLLIPQRIPTDEFRLMDLTHVISQDSNSVLVHRLDRLYVDITSANAVARIGRQAVSWGNGLIYTPMDFFNPFDPAAVDKEYKTGDDMLYGQYLRQNGDDLQAVWVLRRDISGDVSSDVDSIAAKYHGFAGEKEYDLLVAQHFDDKVFGLGGITNVGGGVWRGDITLTDTETDNVFSLVTSLSYSWIGWGKNTSGILEYFYNGFGIDDGNYSPAALANNPDLVERIVRGELFTLGRHYLAASATVEMTPLWLLTPNAFINLSDASMLAQLVSAYDLKQDLQLLAALGVPIGAPGTEYGGIDSAVPGKTFSTSLSVFAQLAWYF
ncbi:MAG: hypothetical protein JSW45_06255 [Thiotrichales bacterium]|nr:MAG: hypothetical protein JSW45_06255 [Thiotrichales bacterium]